MRCFVCRPFFLLAPLILLSSSADAGTKVALVTSLRNPAVSDMLVLAEVDLSDREGVTLLDRQGIL